MKVLITATNGNLDSPVDMRFARAPFIIITDTENIENAEIIQNPFINQPSGAGITAAQFAVERGVQAVISGAFGPNSSMILSSAGIQMITENSGISVKNAIEKLAKGEYQTTNIPQNTQNFYGTNYGGFYPMFGGFGFGRWSGFGRGFGWGRGFGLGWAPNRGVFPSPSPIYDEKTFLKNIVDNLKNQLKYYEERLSILEKDKKEEE